MMSFETLRLVLLILHFLGLAALIGPALIRGLAGSAAVPVMLTGAVIQVVTGNGLIAANQLQGIHVIEAKMIAKLALALLAVAVLIVATVQVRRAKQSNRQANTTGLQHGAAGSGGASLMLAVLWS